MLLLGIKLFLRADELVHLQFKYFLQKCFILHRDIARIDRLAISIKGKTDAKWVHLVLYRDDENPEFCAMRHLLVYLAYTNISGGYLFPDWKVELRVRLISDDNKNTWEAVTHVKYRSFLDRLKVSQMHSQRRFDFLCF